MSYNILHIDSSPRGGDSVSKKLSAQIVEQIKAKNEGAEVVYKDVTQGLPFVDGLTLTGFWTPEEEHSAEIKAAIAPSNQAVKELFDADTIVIGVPMWNFSIPATLKAWVDLIVRGGVTFKLGENGYEGLVPNKKVYLVVSTGGVPVGSDHDMCSTYMKTVFGLLGITDVEVIAADALMMPNGEENLKKAEAEIAAI